VFFYAGSPDAEERMHVVAGQVRESLDPLTRDVSTVLPIDRQRTADAPSTVAPLVGSDQATADPQQVLAATPDLDAKARAATDPDVDPQAVENPAADPTGPPPASAQTNSPGPSAIDPAQPSSRMQPVASSVPQTAAATNPPPVTADPVPPPTDTPLLSDQPPAVPLPPVPLPPAEVPGSSPVSASLEFAAPQQPAPPAPDRRASSRLPLRGSNPATPPPLALQLPTPAAQAHPRLRVQPVPEPAASAVPPPTGIEEERSRLRRARSREYESAASVVTRLLSQSPALRAGAETAGIDVVTDLVAVQLYLSSDGQVDRMIRSGVAGPHTALARCAAMGLRRLPSFRGATAFRATLSDAEWSWYHDGKLVVEWAFAASWAGAAPVGAGNADILIWSMTGRRIALIAPELRDLVLFMPGSGFKVLQARTGARRMLLLRELVSGEMQTAGRVKPESGALDRLALAGLERAAADWPTDESSGLVAAAPAPHRLNQPPGLIVGE
jgi:hypothetical protein